MEQAKVREEVKQVSEDERKEKGKKREATDDDEEEVSEDENNGTGVYMKPKLKNQIEIGSK